MKFPLCVGLLLVGSGILSSARSLPLPVDVDLLGDWEAEIVQSKNSSTRPFAEDCQEFCSYTYPEHTYPEPANFKACSSGCRAAQLDAFIAWPVKADTGKCEKACREMYTVEDQLFACSTGCQTPTIDSIFPNRSHLYQDGNSTAEIDLILSPIESTFSYFFDSFFSSQNSPSFDDLTEHAQDMEVLVVPYLRSDVTILTNDGVYTYREYSFDNGVAMLQGDPRPPSYSDMGNGYFNQHRRSNCMWLLHRSMLNRILLVLSVGLTIVAMASCCLSACSEDKKRGQKVSSIKTNFPVVPMDKKAPYDLGPQFTLPEKVHLDVTPGQVKHKITML